MPEKQRTATPDSKDATSFYVKKKWKNMCSSKAVRGVAKTKDSKKSVSKSKVRTQKDQRELPKSKVSKKEPKKQSKASTKQKKREYKKSVSQGSKSSVSSQTNTQGDSDTIATVRPGFVRSLAVKKHLEKEHVKKSSEENIPQKEHAKKSNKGRILHKEHAKKSNEEKILHKEQKPPAKLTAPKVLRSKSLPVGKSPAKGNTLQRGELMPQGEPVMLVLTTHISRKRAGKVVEYEDEGEDSLDFNADASPNAAAEGVRRPEKPADGEELPELDPPTESEDEAKG